jgi:hypothetical protein
VSGRTVASESEAGELTVIEKRQNEANLLVVLVIRRQQFRTNQGEIGAWFNYRALQSLRSQFLEAPAPVGGRTALNAENKRETIVQPKRASGQSFALVVTRKRPSLNRAPDSTPPLQQGGPSCLSPAWPRMAAGFDSPQRAANTSCPRSGRFVCLNFAFPRHF